MLTAGKRRFTWRQRLRAYRRFVTPTPRLRWEIGESTHAPIAQWFHEAFDGATVGAAVVSLQGRILETNPALRAMLGYGVEELRQLSVTALTHPDDYAAARVLFWQLLAGTRDSYRLEKRYLRQDGSIAYGLLNVSLLRSSNGAPQSLLAIVEDLGHRRPHAHLSDARHVQTIGQLAVEAAQDLDALLQDIWDVTDALRRSLRQESQRAQTEEVLQLVEDGRAVTHRIFTLAAPPDRR